MVIVIVLLIIIVACLIYLGFFIFKRWPDLKNLDIGSITKEKESKVKTKILQDKLLRQGAKIKERLSEILSPQKKFFSKQFKNLKDKIIALESKYQLDKKNQTPAAPRSIKELLAEAEDLIGQQEFAAAEKDLIEVIAKDKKNIRAYELLGDLYFENKNYNQAEEVYKYLLKLNTLKDRAYDRLGVIALKKDQLEEAEMDFLNSLNINNKVALYYDDLAQVYEATAKPEKALECYLKATTIESNNPKYLDKLIEYSIKVGDKSLARKTFNHFRRINPDNAKLAELAATIEKMPTI